MHNWCTKPHHQQKKEVPDCPFPEVIIMGKTLENSLEYWHPCHHSALVQDLKRIAAWGFPWTHRPIFRAQDTYTITATSANSPGNSWDSKQTSRLPGILFKTHGFLMEFQKYSGIAYQRSSKTWRLRGCKFPCPRFGDAWNHPKPPDMLYLLWEIKSLWLFTRPSQDVWSIG